MSEPSIVVHHLNNSRSQRILWLLEELEVPYTIKRYQRMPNQRAPKELRDVHPLGKSPVITDGDVTVAESGAIIEYLINKYGNGRFLPTSEEDKLKYTYWLHYSEGSIQPLLVQKFIATEVPKQAPLLIRWMAKAVMGGLQKALIDPQITTHLKYIESQLPHGGYFAGSELTGADFAMIFPCEAAAVGGRGMGEVDVPNMKDFVKRMQARPAYQRALEKGGEYFLVAKL
ncbi:hypothetical protein HK104_004758 [Borealophlyctis nickersoniae]|nr:hypothetical protein HK104_004758 [Borealophlyctis nickersoniae]